jgi:hypothetical protein
VDESSSVCRLECIGNLAGDVERLLKGELSLPLKKLGEGFAIYVRGDIEGDPLGMSTVEHWKDVGMLERGCYPDFPLEALSSKQRNQFRTEDLYSDE